MINNTKNLHDEKIKSLADKYESQGFRVLLKPKADELPFYLGNYQPEMIAIKDGSGLVIEVKNSLNRLSVDRLQALAEEVSKHQDWRFLLVTLEDIEAKSLPGTSEQLPSWQELTDRFFQAHRLIENDEIEPAFLFLWSIFEGILRKRAIDVLIPIERFPFIGLLKHLYSLGELSISQFDLAQACFEVRNRLAHGYIEKLNPQVLHDFDKLVRELLREWINESGITEKLAVLKKRLAKYDQIFNEIFALEAKDYQTFNEIVASELVNIDTEKKEEILLNIKRSFQEKGLEKYFNDLQHLTDESYDSSITVESNNQQLNKNQVVLLDKAQIALDALQTKEQETIINAINCLENFPDCSVLQIANLSSIPNYFIARQGKYRIIFKFKPEEVTIVDIVNSDRINILYGSLKEAKT
ncbi:MAG: hypothetical protein V7K25_04400 [Nostoc sp.]|uniref:hypothetical protein n=1 Tax=Nostoc sp. TaxID=1180 RepID=UPI002FF67965